MYVYMCTRTSYNLYITCSIHMPEDMKAASQVLYAQQKKLNIFA